MNTPLAIWQRLRAGNRLVSVQSADQPVAAVFRCADARLTNEAVLGQAPGALLDISTWGHAVDAGVLGSLEYAVEILEVPLIVVLGHDDCPAMQSALKAWEHAELPGGSMRRVVEHALLSVVRRGTAADSVQSVAAAHVVETGVALAQRSPALSTRVDQRTCGIICATYASTDLRVRVHATIGAVDDHADPLAEVV
ncbi:Carbonic anhydrase [Mycolicibacterium vanbaalenii]|uniref:Carbonic anhydrase n=1 Tax=Mycolicibacterium vanbaalenii TaxID=110539 RepID=A0A5S9R1F5_MYCVN|nr:carbonic anhydrase [Mycolicibacterium vanbaalenii]CAA0126002.1 Carbonic anhydrase [Mycolicibacterium vanbaalenii]